MWFEMGDFERKSDGRRIFNTEFKRLAVERIRAGETTVAAPSRELSVAPAPGPCLPTTGRRRMPAS